MGTAFEDYPQVAEVATDRICKIWQDAGIQLEGEVLKNIGPVALYLFYVLQHCLRDGKFGFIDGNIFPYLYKPEMQTLQWITIGPVLETWLERSALTDKELAIDTMPICEMFAEISNVILPRFADKLNGLLATLENQAKRIELMKSKILAIIVSVCITIGSTVGQQLGKLIDENLK